MSRRWLAIGLVLLACGLGCGEEPAPGGAASERAIVIGIDGASMRVIAPLFEAGELPNLAAIAAAGSSGTLDAPLPLQSPRIWNTIVTGKLPEKHGVLGFSRRVQGRWQLYLSHDRFAHAVWNIASDAGYRVAVVNFWNTYPPEKINGVMVSDHILSAEIKGRMQIGGVREVPSAALIHPEAWAGRLLELLAEKERATRFPDPLADTSALAPLTAEAGADLQRRTAEDDAIVRISRAVDRELRPDLMMVLLPGIDRVAHYLWGYLEPNDRLPDGLVLSDAQRAAGAEMLRDYYRYTDALIGVLLADYGPQDLVFVVSDHGFETGAPMERLTGTHESASAADGVFFVRGRDIDAVATPQEIEAEDVTPTLLTWLGLPVGEDMDGSIAPFLSRQAPPPVASHDVGEIERLTSSASGAEEAIIEELRSLGYLE